MVGLDKLCSKLGGLGHVSTVIIETSVCPLTIGEVFLIIHQPVAENAFTNDILREVGFGAAEGQVRGGWMCVVFESTLYCEVQWCACHLTRAAGRNLLNWIAEHAGGECETKVVCATVNSATVWEASQVSYIVPIVYPRCQSKGRQQCCRVHTRRMTESGTHWWCL